MQIIYDICILLYGMAIRVYSLINSKAGKWLAGRKNWESALVKEISGRQGMIWVHCSSLGEFEQGRPLIEALSKRGHHILLSFFSPSGYENLKNYKYASLVTYLPLDTGRNARKWIEIIRPKAVFFVKYEFWFNYISAAAKTGIPVFLVSGIFREDHYFFKPYGSWFLKQLKLFSHFFVQDSESMKRLQNAGIDRVTVSGDIRFDRVSAIAASAPALPEVSSFAGKGLVMIAGSTWPEDEELLAAILPDFPAVKLIVAPHEVNDARINSLMDRFGREALLYKDIGKVSGNYSVLVIDRIGLLSSLYRYGHLAFIGGGFDRGIHNTLEAAVYGIPIAFGPNHTKFREALAMVSGGGASVIRNKSDLSRFLSTYSDEEKRKEAGGKNSDRKSVV